MSDLKVKVGQNHFYPDVLVDCGDDDDTANKPILIIEVLSTSTAFLDKTKKLWEYAQIDSLQEYATISQDKKKQRCIGVLMTGETRFSPMAW